MSLCWFRSWRHRWFQRIMVFLSIRLLCALPTRARILMALSATILSSAATLSPAGGSLEPNGSAPVNETFTVYVGQAPLFVQTSFGTIGFCVHKNFTLGITSSPGTISEVSAFRMGLLESTCQCAPCTYNTLLLIYGNGGYLVRVVTSMGTYNGILQIKGLPNYAPGDPRQPWKDVGPVIVP